MNTVKIFITAIVILALSIITGCSDNITSPVTQSKTKSIEVNTTEDNISTTVFHEALKLSPGQEYSFSYSNTGFYRFNSVTIPDCDLTKSGLEVIGYLDDEAIVLGCSNKGFWVQSISVTNTSGRNIEADIYLTGSKENVKHIDPKIIK